jgi:hypothetical protein
VRFLKGFPLNDSFEPFCHKQWDGRPPSNGIDGASAMQATTMGLDLVKNLFQVHGVDSRGKAVLRKELRRDQLMLFFSNLPPCLIGIEVCGGSPHWGRQLQELAMAAIRIGGTYAIQLSRKRAAEFDSAALEIYEKLVVAQTADSYDKLVFSELAWSSAGSSWSDLPDSRRRELLERGLAVLTDLQEHHQLEERDRKMPARFMKKLRTLEKGHTSTIALC